MEKMKDSGIEWIGEIPECWNTKRLRYVCNFKTGGTPNDKMGINGDAEGYPWITAIDMNETYKINEYTQYISEEAVIKCKYKLFPPKSILLVCIASVGKLGIINTYAYSNQQITAIMPNKNVNELYLLYYIQSICHKIIADSSNSVVPIINTTYLKDIMCVLPNVKEQELIASFLDNKVGKVDDILNDLNKQIEILEKYKRSIITETVTKGLNSNVEMKDSGIEWIGNIPTETNMVSIGALIMTNKIEVQDGNHGELHPVAADYVDDGIPFIMASDIHNGKLNLKECKFITEEKANQLRIGFAKDNDVLLTHKGTIGEVGIVENIKTPFIMLTPQVTYYRILDEKYLYNRYLYFVLQSKYIANQLEDISSMQSTRKYVGILAQKKIKLIVHNIEEQKEIADYLEKRCAQIDEIIIDKQAQIDKMKKYKDSLIYEYVTGKKRVKGAKELYV